MKFNGIRVSRSFLWIAAGWAVTVVAGLIVIGPAARSHATPSAHPGALSLPSLAQPFVSGQKSTVAAAQAAVGFPVPVPDVAAASGNNLSQTWLDIQQQQVALVFDGGKLTIMMRPASYKDATTEFQTFIAENDANVTIGQINGQPALVIQPETDTPGPTRPG